MAECNSIQTDIKEATASGVNSTAVSAPTVFNYPVQPPRDDGRMLAVASLLASLIDTALGGDDEAFQIARDAETKWAELVDKLKSFGTTELDRVGTERDKLPPFETDLSNQLTWERGRADEMFAWGTVAKTCADEALSRLCAYVACGYTPQYTAIQSRVAADTAIQRAKAQGEICRTANRYALPLAHSLSLDLDMAQAAAYVGASTAAIEAERKFAWDTNTKLRFDLQRVAETTTESRFKLGMAHDTQATAIATERWNAYANSAFKSMREAGEMLAAAAQAYQMLAASARQTAKQGDGGGWAGILLKLAAVLGLFNGKCGEQSIFGLSWFARPEVCCSSSGA
jgi:hypothetical protein